MSQTKGMTLEDISVLFGDPVELSFEQALSQEHTNEKMNAEVVSTTNTQRLKKSYEHDEVAP